MVLRSEERLLADDDRCDGLRELLGIGKCGARVL